MNRACDIIKIPRIKNLMIDTLLYSNSVGREVKQHLCEVNGDVKVTKPIFGSLMGVSTYHSVSGCKATFGKNADYMGSFHTHPTQKHRMELRGDAIFSPNDIISIQKAYRNNTINTANRNVFGCIVEPIGPIENPIVRVKCIDSDSIKNIDYRSKNADRRMIDADISAASCATDIDAFGLSSHKYIEKNVVDEPTIIGHSSAARRMIFLREQDNLKRLVRTGRISFKRANIMLQDIAIRLNLDVENRIVNHKRRL